MTNRRVSKIIFTSIAIIYSSLIYAQTDITTTELCHPAVDTHLPQYIVGYGSLIQTQSKNKTYHGTSSNLPVMVYGYQRGWFTKGNSLGFSTTFLGVIRDQKSKFNGVIFKLPANGLLYYDKRERIYCREAVASSNIEMLNHQAIPNGQFWIYVTPPARLATPSATYPIVQSYVDTFLSGCFATQEQYHLQNFASDCVDTTRHWSSAWVNDRVCPRRPLEYQPAATQIDELLVAKMPEIFRKIRIE